MSKDVNTYKLTKYCIAILLIFLCAIYLFSFRNSNLMLNEVEYEAINDDPDSFSDIEEMFFLAACSMATNIIVVTIMYYLNKKNNSLLISNMNILLSIISFMATFIQIFAFSEKVSSNWKEIELFVNIEKQLIFGKIASILFIVCLFCIAFFSLCNIVSIKKGKSSDIGYVVSKKISKLDYMFCVINISTAIVLTAEIMDYSITNFQLIRFYPYIVPVIMLLLIVNKLIVEHRSVEAILVYLTILISWHSMIYTCMGYVGHKIEKWEVSYFILSLTCVFVLYIINALFKLYVYKYEGLKKYIVCILMAVILIILLVVVVRWRYADRVTDKVDERKKNVIENLFMIELPEKCKILGFESDLPKNDYGRIYVEFLINEKHYSDFLEKIEDNYREGSKLINNHDSIVIDEYEAVRCYFDNDNIRRKIDRVDNHAYMVTEYYIYVMGIEDGVVKVILISDCC